MGDFDLLATHELGGVDTLNGSEESEKLLVWHKLKAEGYQPAARTGHSSVTVGFGSVAFGGIEAGKRVNTSVYLDAANISWSILPCRGELPSARSYHAACGFEELMIVHGGEGLQQIAAPEEAILGNFEGTMSSTLSRSAAGRDVKPHYRASQPLEGIMPGDNIHPSRLGSSTNIGNFAQSRNGEPASASVHCLDDMYALDCSSLTWVRVQCSLSPLPRKGHTLNVCRVYGKQSLLLTGGYSIETTVVSSSILICDTEQVSKYVHQVINKKRNRTPKHKPNNNAEEILRPVVWRSVQCKGPMPAGRYRHTTSIVSTDREELLVMIGGIGKDSSVALADVHILNLGSLTWIQIQDPSAEPSGKGIAASLMHMQSGQGHGPFTGVFGHVAFPVRKPKGPNQDHTDDMPPVHGFDDYEIIIFGGSSSPSDCNSSGYHSLFAYDLNKHDWRRVQTGPDFPSSRCFHSATFVPNWSPFHELPFEHSALHRNNSLGGNISQLKRTNSTTIGLLALEDSLSLLGEEDDFYVDLSVFNFNQQLSNVTGSIIIFGGSNVQGAVNDAWALDLHWRAAGLDQYDNTVASRLQERMDAFAVEAVQLSSRPAMNRVPFSSPDLHHANPYSYAANPASTASSSKLVSMNNAKYLNQPTSARMRVSSSEPFLGESKSNKMKLLQHLTNAALGQDDDENAENVVHKLRRDRALADIQLKEEKNRLLATEKLLSEKSFELDQLRALHATEIEDKDKEIAKLKETLSQSLEREIKLTSLNAEAYQLLGLHGVNGL